MTPDLFQHELERRREKAWQRYTYAPHGKKRERLAELKKITTEALRKETPTYRHREGRADV